MRYLFTQVMYTYVSLPSAVSVLAVSLFHTRAMLEGPAECSHCVLQDQETEGRELERWRRVKFKTAMVKLRHAIWCRRRLSHLASISKIIKSMLFHLSPLHSPVFDHTLPVQGLLCTCIYLVFMCTVCIIMSV